MGGNYALYYTLNKNLKETPLQAKEKKQMVQAVSSMSSEQHKAFFLLMCEHQNATGELDMKTPTLPYGCKQVGDDVKISTTTLTKKIPIPLQWILYKFVTIICAKEDKDA